MDFVRSREEDFFCRQSAKSTFTLRGTFFYYYADDDFLLFFFFSFLFFVEEEEEKSKAKAKGEIVWGRRIFLSTPSPRIDLTDLSLSLSLSFGTKRGGKKKKKKNAMTREDDLYRALGIERTASQEEIRKAYKTTGTL